MTNNDISFAFKLATRLSINNMHLFDASGNIKKYSSTKQILQDFFAIRLEYYERRKVWDQLFHLWFQQETLLFEIGEKLKKLNNQIRFIGEVLDDTIDFRKMNRNDVLEYIQKNNYHPGRVSSAIINL